MLLQSGVNAVTAGNTDTPLVAAIDADRSGSIDMAELRRVVGWLRASAPSLTVDALWEALPESGGSLDAPAFEQWLLAVTRTLDSDAFDQLTDAIESRLQAERAGGSMADAPPATALCVADLPLPPLGQSAVAGGSDGFWRST